MEQTPPPVDLNRLKGILSGAKTIMKKVDSGNYTTGHIDGRALTEDGVQLMQNEGVVRPALQQPFAYSEDAVKNSHMPEAVKKIMLERPIPQLSMSSVSSKFSLGDVADLIEDKPMPYPQTKQPNIQARNVMVETANHNSDVVTVSKSQLKEMVKEWVDSMVNEKLLEHMTSVYKKNITEAAVKSTLSTLVKEGKIVAKKKV